MKIELDTDTIFQGVEFTFEIEVKSGPRFRAALVLLHLASWVLGCKIKIA